MKNDTGVISEGFSQVQSPKLITVVRRDLPIGSQIAQVAHSVADFAYHLPVFFKDWREKSNYKICLSAADENQLTKTFEKLKQKGAPVVAFHEPDLNNEMTAITFYGTPQYRKYTSYLPLAGKEFNGGIAQSVRAFDSKSETQGRKSFSVGSSPTAPTFQNNFTGNKTKES